MIQNLYYSVDSRLFISAKARADPLPLASCPDSAPNGCNHAVVVVEDLQVAHMPRSAKGTLEESGRHVNAKAGLNKAILDQGWGMFRRLLTYKQTWRGGEVTAVNPRYTSQRCADCGHVRAKNRVQQALFSCQACGHSYHADVNAAQNILALGQGERLNACSPR